MYPRMVEILQLLSSSSLMMTPPQSAFDSPVHDDIEQYFVVAKLAARDRVKLFRLAWDIACSAFGGRQVLYERFFAGDFYRNVAVHYTNVDKRPYTELVEAFLAREPALLPDDH